MPRSFEELFAEAIVDWPPILRLKVRRLRAGSWILEGLTDLCDSLDPYRAGQPDEVLFINLNWAIVGAIKRASRGWPDRVFSIATAAIRPDQVRGRFEDSLRSALTWDDGSWPEADLAVIRAYLDGAEAQVP